MLKSAAKKATVVSMFSGCGGFDLGLKTAGYDIVWANDINRDACETYRNNIGPIHEGDIHTMAIPRVANLDLLVAGFPCQPFSNAGSRKGIEDGRGNLYEKTFDFIEALNPKAVVYENVRGLLSTTGKEKKLIDEITDVLRDRFGYSVEHRLLNFSHFGVPQNRIRVVLVAVKDKNFLSHAFPEIVVGKDLSIQRTLKGLTEHTPNQTELLPLNPQALHYGAMIPEGGSWKSLPYEVLPPRWKKIRDNMARYHYPNFFKRYHRTDISGTITAAFKPENAAVWHPTKQRIFSVREVARIQTFPDDFVFYGSSIKSKYQQIGNAVPPLIGELLGRQLLPYFEGEDLSALRRRFPESYTFNVNRAIDPRFTIAEAS